MLLPALLVACHSQPPEGFPPFGVLTETRWRRLGEVVVVEPAGAGDAELSAAGASVRVHAGDPARMRALPLSGDGSLTVDGAPLAQGAVEVPPCDRTVQPDADGHLTLAAGVSCLAEPARVVSIEVQAEGATLRGEGAAPVRVDVAPKEPTLYLTARSGLRLENLDLHLVPGPGRRGTLQLDTTAPVHDVVLRRVRFTGVKGQPDEAWGLRVEGTFDGLLLHEVEVSGVGVVPPDTRGQSATPLTLVASAPSRDLVLMDVHVHDVQTGWSEAISVRGPWTGVAIDKVRVEDFSNIGLDLIGPAHGQLGVRQVWARDLSLWTEPGAAGAVADRALVYVDGAHAVVFEDIWARGGSDALELGHELDGTPAAGGHVVRGLRAMDQTRSAARVGGFCHADPAELRANRGRLPDTFGPLRQICGCAPGEAFSGLVEGASISDVGAVVQAGRAALVLGFAVGVEVQGWQVTSGGVQADVDAPDPTTCGPQPAPAALAQGITTVAETCRVIDPSLAPEEHRARWVAALACP
jgi:hypothetical protein